MKKILKWLIPVCVAVIAAVVGLILFLGQSDDGAGAKKTAGFKLYWNVDGKPYRTGKMIRTADRDGRVTITFAVDGDQVRIPVADPDLGMRIDMLQMVGLEINEEGVITDCYRVEDMGGKIIANNYLVTKVEGNTITCNSSIAATGYDVVFELDENTGVWDVGMDGITCGFPTAVKVNDQVIVCTDPDGNVDTVYVLPFQAPPPIYWNIDRKYDTTNKVCTREMDPMGGYTLQLAVNGEIVTVQTRDWELVQKMDAMAAKCFALEFDEEGALVDVIHAGTATGGGSFASWFSVDSIEGKTLTCTKQSTGTSASGILGPEVQVYDVSGYGAFVGEPTDIRVGDTVHCLKDSLGRIVVVFVVNRMVDSEIYWNVERKWDSKTSLSTRTADAAGWYHIKVAVGGKQITVKTQDSAIVQAIDERAAKCFGLKLNGDVIEKVYLPTAVTGGPTFASWYDITELNDRKLTCYKTTTGDVRTGTIAPGCEIYNVSTSAGTVGEVTTLQVGDRIHALKNREGQISVIFVVNRFYDYPTYYNLVRKWDAKTESTTRTPDASGYYVFEMAFEGKVVTVKTKSKDIANDIDSQAAKCVALSVTNGIVTKAIHPGSTTAYKGGATSSYCLVTSASKAGFNTKKVENGQVTKTYEETYAADCKIYNVSDNFTANKGEKTTIQVGDKVHCLKNSKGEVALVYVIQRFADLKIYYNLERKWSDATETTTRVPDANGYYVFRMAHDGKEVQVKTKSLVVANAIDSQVAKVVGLEFGKDGLVTKAIHAGSTKTCQGGATSSYCFVTAATKGGFSTQKLENGKVTKTYQETYASDCKIYNVSGNFVSHKGEKTTLQVGDKVHCLKNGQGQVVLVYVLERYADLEIYYNLERKWSDTTETTTRTPDANGYYVFRMAHDGKEVTVKTKSLTVANAIDSQVAKVLGLEFGKDGLVTKAIHAGSTKACRGGATSSYCFVTAATKSGFTTQKLENGKVTKTYQETYASDCKIYNVSDNYVNNKGEKTTIQVGDKVHCLKNSQGKVVLVYVLERYADLEIYYNLERKWSDTTGATTRTPDADGYYVFRMAHDGKEVQVKTKSLTVANAIDSQVAKVVGLGFDQNGLVNKAIHAKSTLTCKGGIGASYAYVVAVNGNQVTYEKDGKQSTFTLSAKANIFDVSPFHKNNLGERTTLRVGDYIHCLKDADGKTNYVFCMNRGIELIKTAHNCQHVTKNVTWYEWNGNSGFGESGHYVLTQDATLAGTVTIEAGKEITLCLNGHTLSSAVRCFKIYGTLNICDHKGADGKYQGKITSSLSDVLDDDGKIVTKAYGSLAYLYNTSASSVLNIYGGTFEHTGSVYAGGLVYIANNADDPKNTAVFNLYDGTLTGGNATNGGAVVVSNIGQFAMYGGSITNCQAQKGGAILVAHEKAGALIAGGTISNNTVSTTGAGIQCDNGLVQITGGLITNNQAIGNGGGVSMEKGTLQMQSGALDGNIAAEGGNLRITRYAEALITGDAKVINGNAKNGGNVTMFGKLTLSGDAHITGGQASAVSTAISVYSNYDDSVVELNVLGGTIEGSVRFTSKKGQSVTMNVLGGTVDTINVSNTADATVEPKLYVGGTANIAHVNLGKGQSIYVKDDLSDTASIGVSMADMSKAFAQTTNPNVATAFHPMDTEMYKVVYVDGKLYIGSAYGVHSHCVCNGNAVSLGNHVCDNTIQWMPWKDTASLPTSGHYYLLEDVALSNMIELKGKADLQICLNGHTITGPGGGKRVFLLRDADLSITDCTGNGVITNEVTDSLNGGLIYQYSGSSCNKYNNTVNLYAGTLTTTGTAKSGGVLYLGNNTTEDYYATFNMYGGTVTGGNTTGNGGNIDVTNKCVVNLYGGSVTGGSAGLGGKVAVYKDCSIYVTGNVQVEDLYLENVTLDVGDLADTAKISLFMNIPGVFATVTDLEDVKCFYPVDKAYEVQNTNGQLSLGEKPEDPATMHIHCLCNGKAVGLGNHVCDDTTKWKAWDQENALPNASGSYYLTTDVTIQNMVELKGGVDLKICLNGHTITGPGGGKRVFLLRDADLSITDCTGNGVITNEATDSLNGGLIYLYKYTNSLNLYAGTLTVTGTAKSGGVLYLGNSRDNTEFALFNMYGGTITGGTTTGAGGNIVLGNSSVMHMYGGSVTGGSAQKGGNIVVYTGCSISFSGNVQISGAAQGGNLYLEKANMTVGDLAETAEIYLTMFEPGAFTTITDGEDAKCFYSDDSAYEVTNADGKLSLTAKVVEPSDEHVHCLCNGNAEGLGDHVCDAATKWTEWNDDKALPSASGNYYLTTDVTVGDMVELKGKLDLKICLNGHTITGPGGNKRIFLLRDADLSITDCTGNGVITNAVNDTLNGGLIYQYSGSSCNKYNNSVNLYGGTLTTTGTAKAGGVLYLGNNSSANYRATFNMYGGTITGGSSTGSGGNIVVSNKCIMNMYGGTVSNGSSDLNGGNIIVTSGCSFHVSGNAQIVNAVKGGSLYLEGATITVGDLAETAKIYLSMKTPGVFTTITDAEDAKCFFSVDDTYQVKNTDGKLSLVEDSEPVTPPPAPVGHVHCVCVGNAKGVAGHECDEDTQWEEWNNDSALPTQSGNYYLNTDVTLSGAKIELKGKIDLRICLNGHTITGPGGGERMFLLRDADLHITDCTGNGVVTNEVTSSLNGGLIYQYSGSSCNKYNNTVNLYAGTLTTTGTAKSGGVLYLGNNTSANYYATFNMYGGTVTGGTTTNSGGNIMMTNACVMNMYGGTVSNGTSGLNGGNIHQANTAGLLNLVGGSVTGGTANGKGGDVYSEAESQISDDVQIGDLVSTVAALNNKAVKNAGSVLTDNMPNNAVLKVFWNIFSTRK